MDRVYPQQVEYTLKTPNGKAVCYPLTRKNLIVGLNGSGKSAMKQAVQLALTGSAEDLAGRSLTRDAALILASTHGHGTDGAKVFARVDLSNGENCQWYTSRDGSTVRNPAHVKPKWVNAGDSKTPSPHIPTWTVRDMLSGDHKKARREILSTICKDVDNNTVERLLGSHYDAFRYLTDNLRLDLVDKLAEAERLADKEMRSLNKTAKDSEARIEEIERDLPPRVDPKDILALQDQIRQLESLRDDILKAEGSAGAVQAHKERVKSLERSLAEAQGALTAAERGLFEAEEHHPEAPADDSADAAGQQAARTALRWVLDAGDEQCPVCSSKVSVTHLQACYDFYEGVLKDNDAAAKEYMEWERAYNDIERAAATATATVERLATELQRVSKSAPVAADLPDTTSAEVRSHIEQARADLQELVTAQSQWSTIERLRGSIDKDRNQSAAMVGLKVAAQKAVKLILEDKVDEFSQRVTDRLPEGWECSLQFDSEGRDVFYYGLAATGPDGRPYTKVGLSEAQRIVFLAAICSALDSYNPQKMSIIMPEDRGWDATTLGEALKGLKGVEQAVFIESTVLPDEDALDGWNVIYMSPKAALRPAAPAFNAAEAASVPVEEVDVAPVKRVPAIAPVVKAPTTPSIAGRGQELPEVEVEQGFAFFLNASGNNDSYEIPEVLSVGVTPMTKSPLRGGRVRSCKAAIRNIRRQYGYQQAAGMMKTLYRDFILPARITGDALDGFVADFLYPVE